MYENITHGTCTCSGNGTQDLAVQHLLCISKNTTLRSVHSVHLTHLTLER